MGNVVSVYFNKVIRRNRGGVSAGLTTLSFVYGLSCALQFCGGKTAVDGSGGYRAGLTTLSSVADKFNFSDFLTETELYKQKRTHSFCLSGRRSASFLRLNGFSGCGIFPQPDLTPGQPAGFSRKKA
ncbi:MAG: hypothetical protein MR662_09240 [Treponema porcinum]|uniref:hypothetical protein n=1 Tax=Treponema porcinum TaxID=261392 RepID=UPI0023541B2F|nr:hypothetical protein [Treponema porcinum]MCI6180659.1 hypothetical protein [Treponema porcinum]